MVDTYGAFGKRGHRVSGCDFAARHTFFPEVSLSSGFPQRDSPLARAIVRESERLL